MANSEYFFIDSSINIKVLWKELIHDINNTQHFSMYCNSSNYYEVFKSIIISLLLDKEIILLDSDFSDDELLKLTGKTNYNDSLIFLSHHRSINVSDKTSLIKKLSVTKDDWRITMYTSGTSGLPKKVSHTFKSITRFVKTSINNSTSKWGFAYNPTHMAGVQVFFQALLNGNTIVRLFGLEKEKIFSQIELYSITHISATPSFYRLLIPHFNSYPSVIRLTSGGEKFDDRATTQLSKIFPKAKIINIYASTEAGTLFASEKDVFTVKPEFASSLKIINGELNIHKSLMGQTDLHYDNWYSTGDMVEVLTENPLTFRFLSRKNEMINVGGYKVNPNEVEETLRDMDGIIDVRLFSKQNSVLGNIICCEVVRSDPGLTEPKIRKFLSTKLQEFKIPRMFHFVKQVSTTRTGKIKRQ